MRRLLGVSRLARPREVPFAGDPLGVRRSLSTAALGALAVLRMRELNHRKKPRSDLPFLGKRAARLSIEPEKFVTPSFGEVLNQNRK
jgi:hypothetical protein